MHQKNIAWIDEAKRIFRMDKPEHFTNHEHCCECEEHDQTLIRSSIDEIGLEELGNPGWDPICFASSEGKKYYMPSFIRLSLDTIDDEFYFAQFLFHLEYDGRQNNLYLSCNAKQREFILKFVEHVILQYSAQLESASCENEAMRVHEIWSNNI